MGFDRRFTLTLALRTALLTAAILLFAAAWRQPGLAAARLVAGCLVAGSAWLLWRHVDRTNREVARFVAALGHGDLAQGFARGAEGWGDGGFGRLGAALDDAMRALRVERARAADENRVHAAIVDEAPTALLTIDREGRVTLVNKAARKLFRQADGVRAIDFQPYGVELMTALAPEGDSFRRLASLRIDGLAQRAILTRCMLARRGEALALLSVQPIQAELSAVELSAQADLVRVLTHEIMNSITPVVSLAASAAELVAELDAERDGGRDPRMADARLAVETLAARAAGIMRFVETYRAFSRAPEIRSRRFPAGPWADELARLFAASPEGDAAALVLDVSPAGQMLDADPDLLAQVVLNLLKNGAEAARGATGGGRVRLAIAPAPNGRTRIAVADNGPGVPAHLAEEIFLPFFTTKADGTGVGLSLARRIVAAHGGALTLEQAGVGACFEVTL